MAKRLLLVGWDAADWRQLQPLLDAGKLPTLQRLVAEGASGPLLGGQPLVSAAQWTCMVTGKRPWQHRVCHQAEFFPQAGRAVPVSASQRQSAALWEILMRKGTKSLVVGWPATHGSRVSGGQVKIVSNRYAEPTAGPGVKPWPPPIPGTYWPESLGSMLDRLRVSPEDIGSDLISHLVPDWKLLDQKRDRRLSHLRVFLATDLSHHAAMLHLLKVSDWNFAAIHYPALGAITAMFLPYLAPRRDWVSEHEFHLYQHLLPSTCLMLDRLLGSLVQAAGKETAIAVASAYGVSPHLPPHYLRAGDNDLWKSPSGIFAVRGPGWSRDSLVLGATLQDVAPTILTWFGLPIGDDMEGRVLMESFAEAPAVTRVESWEPDQPPTSEASQRASNRSSDDPAAARLSLEYDWNLARFALDAARYDEALPWLEKLFRSFPERAEFGQTLFQCQLTLKQTAAAAETLGILLEALPPGIGSLLCRVELLIAEGKRKQAWPLVAEIQRLKPAETVSLRRLGMILWRLRQWNDLAELAQEVLRLDANEPLAWLAQAEASLRLGRSPEAIESAERALSLNYFMPQAHLILARALLNQGKWAEAREAMQVVLRLQPNNRAAAAYWRRSGLEQQPPTMS